MPITRALCPSPLCARGVVQRRDIIHLELEYPCEVEGHVGVSGCDGMCGQIALTCLCDHGSVVYAISGGGQKCSDRAGGGSGGSQMMDFEGERQGGNKTNSECPAARCQRMTYIKYIGTFVRACV